MKPRAYFAYLLVTLGLLASACTPLVPVAYHSATPVVSHTPLPLTGPPTIRVYPPDASQNLRLDTVVTLTTDGQLTSVAVRHSDGTSPLAGSLSPSKNSWLATDTLDPNTSYIVDATASDALGATTLHESFATTTAGRLTSAITPDDNSTVGVAMPIIFKFNTVIPAAQQQGIVDHINVVSSPATIGDWHWYSGQEVHFRPENPWLTGTKVTVNVNLKGVDAGNGIWGLESWTSHFTIGDKHVSVIDLNTYQIQVYNNDQLLYTWPMSGGKPGFTTIGGTMYVPFKSPAVYMSSTSIGIPLWSSNGYADWVYQDVAFSYSGYYIHSAPWSVWAQGSQNVSHGCVNLSPEHATTFYDFSQIGDEVQVLNSSLPADQSDGEADWNIPFAQYANSGSSSVPTGTPSDHIGGE